MKNRIMKVSIALLILLLAITIANCKKQENTANQPGTTTQGTTQPGTATDTTTASTGQDLVSRGKFLVAFGGCNDCHTPKSWGAKGPELDNNRLLSGHPANVSMPTIGGKCLDMKGWAVATSADFTVWVGPWGTSYTANLTPDQTTGTGSWDENMFIQTLRNGKHMGTGRDLLPPMPWQEFAKASDEDLRAIFAYIHSLPAINNQVPQPIPPKGGPGGAPGGAPAKGTGGTGVGG